MVPGAHPLTPPCRLACATSGHLQAAPTSRNSRVARAPKSRGPHLPFPLDGPRRRIRASNPDHRLPQRSHLPRNGHGPAVPPKPSHPQQQQSVAIKGRQCGRPNMLPGEQRSTPPCQPASATLGPRPSPATTSRSSRCDRASRRQAQRLSTMLHDL